MAYNRENNIDDLIELTTRGALAKEEETFYLVLENYDGKGCFSNPPYVYGLSQVVHIFRRNELDKTVEELLQQYPEGGQFFTSEDAFNLITHKNVRVTPKDKLYQVFGGETRAILYVQNRAYTNNSPLLDEECGGENGKKKRFNWRRCLIIFTLCWILKFFVVFGVLFLLRQYQII